MFDFYSSIIYDNCHDDEEIVWLNIFHLDEVNSEWFLEKILDLSERVKVYYVI